MVQFTLIAADWWNLIVPLVFVVIYLLNHLLSGGKQQPGKPREQQRRRPAAGERPLRPAPKQQQRPGQPQLNAEIEQFLRRANQRRMEKAGRETTPTRPTPQKPPLAPPPPPLREEPLEIEPLAREDFESVEQSVEKHLGQSSFRDHLAEEVAQADEDMERHLKQTFDHQLGSLSHAASNDPSAPHDVQAPITRGDPQATAKALAGLLTNQRDLRQAILLKEILDRPVDRW